MTVNFEEVKKLIGKKVAIHCDREYKAEDLLMKLNKLGGEWLSGDNLNETSRWSWYEEDTCYVIKDIKFTTYSGSEHLKEEGFEIYKYEITEMEKSELKIHELVEGVEYKIADGGFKYRVVDKVLEAKSSCGIDEWSPSGVDYNFIMNAKFEECEFKPRKRQVYYFPVPHNVSLFKAYKWLGTEGDKSIKRNVGIYRTKEQAIKKAKELGWS